MGLFGPLATPLEKRVWNTPDHKELYDSDYRHNLWQYAGIARDVVKGIPVVEQGVDLALKPKWIAEKTKWIHDWERNTKREMAYPLLSMAGAIPSVGQSVSELLGGSLYKPPTKTQRRF